MNDAIPSARLCRGSSSRRSSPARSRTHSRRDGRRLPRPDPRAGRDGGTAGAVRLGLGIEAGSSSLRAPSSPRGAVARSTPLGPAGYGTVAACASPPRSTTRSARCSSSPPPAGWSRASSLRRPRGSRRSSSRASCSTSATRSSSTSQRGVEGGYALARPADEISLADVIRAVEGPIATVRGVRPDDVDYDGAARALAPIWIDLRAAMRGVLEETTLADLFARVAGRALGRDEHALAVGPTPTRSGRARARAPRGARGSSARSRSRRRR